MGGGLEGVSGMANCSLMRRRSCAATGCPCIEAALADASAVAMVAMAARVSRDKTIRLYHRSLSSCTAFILSPPQQYAVPA